LTVLFHDTEPAGTAAGEVQGITADKGILGAGQGGGGNDQQGEDLADANGRETIHGLGKVKK
jgi:hypothetical protein